jgi:hypothetical protein
MAITYEWSFPSLDVIYNQVNPQTGESLQNVVTTVHWIYTGRDGDYTATMYSSVGLSEPGQPFTEYEDLTHSIVQGWVESTLGVKQVEEMQKSLSDSIEHQKKPTSGSMTPSF